jgi:hypothetical protein
MQQTKQTLGDAWELGSRLYEEQKRREWALAWASYHGDQAGRLEAVLTERVAHHRQEESRYREMLTTMEGAA